jgi:hypothetical protein
MNIFYNYEHADDGICKVISDKSVVESTQK